MEQQDKVDKLEIALEKLRKAEAAVKRIKQMNEKKSRAEDTRKKVLAGAAVLSFLNRLTTNEEQKIFISKVLKHNLNEADFKYLISKVEGIKID